MVQHEEQIMEELNEEHRRRRMKYLILFKVKEEDTEEATIRSDMERCTKVFSEVLEVGDAEIRELRQLGNPARGKDRSLLVKINNSATKYTILKQARD